MLPSFSFGAEGVEYGRAASYYATTAGNEVFPDDVNVQGNLTVEGSTTLRGTAVNGSLTVAQPIGGGTRTAYFTNGASPPAEKSVAIFNDQSSGTQMVMRNNGNEGIVAFDGGVTGGQFVLNRPLVVQANTEGSNGNVVVGGKALVFDGIYGASLTTPPSFPVGFTSAVPPTSSYQLLTATPGQSSSFNVTASSGSIYLGNLDTTPDIFEAGVTSGWALKYGIALNNPSWNSKTIILTMVRPLPVRLVTSFPPTLDYGVISSSVNYTVNPTGRALNVNGFGTLPSAGIGRDYYVDFVIFQGV